MTIGAVTDVGGSVIGMALGGAVRATRTIASRAIASSKNIVDDVAEGAVRKIARGGGQGLIGLVKPSTSFDDSLRGIYRTIAQSKEFARDVAAYNRLARRFGQTEAASVDDILTALDSDTAFALVSNPRAGLFVGQQHTAVQKFLIQGNPSSLYGPRAARHELVHLGASLKGQKDRLTHEILVQLSTTPEVGLGIGGGVLTLSVGTGVGIGWWLFGGDQ